WAERIAGRPSRMSPVLHTPKSHLLSKRAIASSGRTLPVRVRHVEPRFWARLAAVLHARLPFLYGERADGREDDGADDDEEGPVAHAGWSGGRDARFERQENSPMRVCGAPIASPSRAGARWCVIRGPGGPLHPREQTFASERLHFR